MTVEHCANGNEIQRAAAFLDAGQLLAFPTETVYGLGADAQNPSAIARVYALKGRPATHPLIVDLGFNADPAYWIHGAMPRAARVLIDAFWPGPLTLILPRAAHIPAAVSGGQPSIGFRCPAHPLAQALLNAFHHLGKIKGTPQRGIAAPSANRFGRVVFRRCCVPAAVAPRRLPKRLEKCRATNRRRRTARRAYPACCVRTTRRARRFFCAPKKRSRARWMKRASTANASPC